MLITTYSLLLLTLFLRGLAAPAIRERITLSLFFTLYLSLLGMLYFWTTAPPEIRLSVLGLGFAGLGWSVLELLFSLFNKKNDRPGLKELRMQKGPYFEIVQACSLLQEARMGALLILERRQILDTWRDKGIAVDARLSKELLFSIFTPPGALHDGAAMVQNERLSASGIILPLSRNPALSKELGTRHRAALGLSEISDALCLIVSEEAGTISLAEHGKLYYDIPIERLAQTLERALRFKLDKPGPQTAGRRRKSESKSHAPAKVSV